MAYDEDLAHRVRTALERREYVTERRMFGGLAFLLNGNMCCGIVGDELMVRLGNNGARAALQEPRTREMDFTAKPLRSMVFVTAEGLVDDDDLERWVSRALEFAKTLPPKEGK